MLIFHVEFVPPQGGEREINMAYTSETYLAVRYAETDMMGIVHHSRYYPWFEQARTDFVKKTGYTYSAMEKMGILLPLSETHCKYIGGMRYEDEAVITCRIEKLTVARIEFSYEVLKKPEMQIMAKGSTVHGFTGTDLKPMNLKKAFPEVWEKLNELV